MTSNMTGKEALLQRTGSNQRSIESKNATEFFRLLRKELDKAILGERYREIQRLKCEALFEGLTISAIPITVLRVSKRSENCDCEKAKKSDEEEGDDLEENSGKLHGPLTEAEADIELICEHFLLPDLITEELMRAVLTEPDDTGADPPLHEAVRGGNIDVVKAMLNLGADVNEKGEFGQTPVHTACVIGNIPILELLVSRGGDLTTVNENKLSALHIAVQQEWPRTTRWLLDRGADINATDSTLATPLHWAAFEGNVPMVKVLLGRGAKTDIHDVEGRTPFEIARAIDTHNHKAVAGILRSRGLSRKFNKPKKNKGDFHC